MKYSIYGFILSVLLLVPIGCKKNTVSGDLVITNVSVVDVKNSKSLPNQTVAIANGKIISITPFSERDNIKAEETQDGSGKYMIPSLWDMHTHYTTSSENNGFLNLFVANGVLGVRDLWGNLNDRDSLLRAKVMSPKIYLSGAIIDGAFTLLQGTLQPKSPEEAMAIVDSLYQDGADFIKVYDDLSPEIYNAIAYKCNELKMPFAGHVPMSIPTEEASKKGQKSMEHLNGIWKSSTTAKKEIDSLQKTFKSHFMQGNLPGAVESFTKVNAFANAFYNEDEAMKLAKVLNGNGTFVTPTLIITDQHWTRLDRDYKNREENKYVPQEFLAKWDPTENFPEKIFPPATWESGKELLKTSMKITKNLHDGGVDILAGTDCGVSYVIPGFSLHDELKLMVDSGLTEAEALATATINPAKYFNISAIEGEVSQNMAANLVLLSANPLDDISNTKKIYAVVRNGEYLDRDVLNNLLDQAVIKE